MALKLALHPGNQRFERERELLSRVRHPGVPRLVDHGEWQSPGGPCYPYLAMEWIDGVSLGVAHGECAPGPCARATPDGVVLKLKPPWPAKAAMPLKCASSSNGESKRLKQNPWSSDRP